MANDKDSKKKGSGPEYRKRFVESDETKTFSSWVKDWQSENYLLNALFGSKHEKFRVGRMLFCLAFSFVFSFLLTFELNLNSTVKLGEVASRTIRAPFDFEVTDIGATRTSQTKAVAQVPLVLDYFPNTYEKPLEDIRGVFSVYRARLANGKEDEATFIKSYKKEFEDSLGVSLSERTFKWIVRKKFNESVESVVIEALENWSTSYMIDKSMLNEGVSNGYALVRTIGHSGEAIGEEQKLDLDNIKTLMSYARLDEKLTGGQSFSKYDKKKLAELLKQFRVANLSINRTVFSKRKTEAKEKVLPVVISVKQNQVILKEGSLIQDQDVLLVSEVVRLKSSLKKRSKVLILTLLLSLILIVGISLLKKRFDFSMPEAKQDFLVLFAIGTIGLIIIKVSIFLFEGALYQKFGNTLPSEVIILLSPFAMLAMLASLLLKSRQLLWLFIVYYSVGLSFLVSDKFSFLLVSLVASMAAIRAFSVCKSRKDFYLAGFVSGVIVGLFAVMVHALKIESFADINLTSLGLVFSASVVGGLLSSIFAVTLVPLFETVFDIMTDLKLLELSSLSHPLLKELMVRAPGTYHHCMVVGSMVEAACNEIGVNGLQAKVMAYFHDVGKMEHAAYFIENQRKNINPHDNISPYLSKTIIIAHVKDGVEIIAKHKLGKAIMAGVKEHHGTTLISYFYKRALNRAEEGQVVKENEFRYPGPKPQSKESAILMIADSIEAAARSIDEPSPLRIQNLIDHMVDSKFQDGQLNECNITFAELTKIKAVFYRVLVGVYHHRVDYAKDKTIKPGKVKEPQTVSLGKSGKQ
ncbi:MAG: HD family phosphohydrolase [Bdellovibrionales bacterium]